METLFWDALGRKPSLVFGQECGSATIWMFVALLQRTIVWFLKLDGYFPFGLFFAFPLLVQVMHGKGSFDCLLTLLCTGIVCNLSVYAKHVPTVACAIGRKYNR